MAELQRGRGPCGEHLMQKCLGVSGTHMLPRYVLSGRGWESLAALAGAGRAHWPPAAPWAGSRETPRWA